MGETIDLNDLSNLEENFTSVKMFGGDKFKRGVRDLRPGASVIYKDNRKWEVVKFDEKDARFLFIRREGEEDKRVYNGDIVIYREPPNSPEEEEFSPRSPPPETRFTPGDKVLYKNGETYTFDRYEGDEAVVIGDDGQEIKVSPKDMIPVDRRLDRDPQAGDPDLSFSPKSPDMPPPGFEPRSPDDEPIPGPRTPSGTPPQSPDEPIPGPRTPDEPIPGPQSPEEPKIASDTDLLKLLDSLETKNLAVVKLVKPEELVRETKREDTGVFSATNKLLGRINSEEREQYLRKINELYELMKKNKTGFSFSETDKNITYSLEELSGKIDKPMYRNVHDLLSNLNHDLEMIEYELREKREKAILNPDPKLNREIQKLNESYKLYSQTLEVYHQYYSLVNNVTENNANINKLSAQRNENRVEQIRLFSEIAHTMNHGTYDNDALNALITEYLSKGTRELEAQLRETREADKVENLIINDYSITTTTDAETSEKPKKRVIKKKKQAKKPKKKNQDELLTDVLTTLEAATEEPKPEVPAEEPEVLAEEPEAAAAEASGDYTVTPDTLIKGKPVSLDGKKQFKEEEVIREKCTENEDCKGFTEKTYKDGKVKYFPRDSTKTVPEKDHRAFIKTGGADTTELGNEVESLLDTDPEIKTIKINTPITGGGSTEKTSTPTETNTDIEELDLPDDLESLTLDDQEYSFIDSYDSDEGDVADTEIPIELNIVKSE